MDKICTRCNFRNPSIRRVCQVCGYSKFAAPAQAAAVVARHPQMHDAKSLIHSIDQLIEDATVSFFTAFKRTMEVLKPNQLPSEPASNAHEQASMSLQQPLEAQTVQFDNNDLDSMIAWFKSYGVDRPLILKAPTISDDHSIAA